MLGVVIAYIAKIGIPTFLITYAIKNKYQEKYNEKVLEYIDRIKELDTENKLWETKYNRSLIMNDELVNENVLLKRQLGVVE